MPWMLKLLYVVWLIQAAWCVVNQMQFRVRARRWDRRMELQVARNIVKPLRAVVIVAVKGADDRLAPHVHALLAQQYGPYRLLFTVESEEDPAYAALRQATADHADRAQLIVAGRASRGSQKVHNLLAALGRLRDEDEVVVFADADMVPHPQWLNRMTTAMRLPEVGATTGYRWIVPRDCGLASLLASMVNASVATLQGPPRRTHAWGGSTAIRRDVIEEAKLREHWDGALSDDYQLTRALRAAGKTLYFMPRCLVVSPERFTWRRLMEFGRRQFLITRVYAPWLWVLGLVFAAIYTAGWVTALGAALLRAPGWQIGLCVWAAVAVLDAVRGVLRQGTVKRLFGEAVAKEAHRVMVLELIGMPLVMGVQLAMVLSSATGRVVRWAGITYDMRGRREVRIVGERDPGTKGPRDQAARRG